MMAAVRLQRGQPASRIDQLTRRLCSAASRVSRKLAPRPLAGIPAGANPDLGGRLAPLGSRTRVTHQASDPGKRWQFSGSGSATALGPTLALRATRPWTGARTARADPGSRFDRSGSGLG